MTDCPICIEPYKGKKVVKVTCQYCPSNACRGCQQRYLLQSYEDPHCMECKRGWSTEFMAANFPLVFRNDVLRKHRRKILFEREKAMLPAMQIYVEYRQKSNEYKQAFDQYVKSFGHPYRPVADEGENTICSRYATLRNALRSLDYRLSSVRGQIQTEKGQLIAGGATAPFTSPVLKTLRAQRDAVKKEMETVDKQFKVAQKEYTEGLTQYQQLQTGHFEYDARYNDRYGAAAAPKREFIMKCPDEGCRGFLSSAYKCGTCAKWTCSDCLVCIGADKEAAHTCDKDTVESAKAIKAETRPCPKCGTRIFKIDGCFAKDTPILLWNSHIKMSQDIRVGDELVGDDGQKRTVEEICNGNDEMYEVAQRDGMTYIVNSKHTLCLQRGGGLRGAAVVEIVMEDYLALSDAERGELLGFNVTGKTTPITVRPLGQGTYYGWSVTGNKRFLLADTTVLRNCDQMWCIMDGCHTAFSWNTGHVVTGVVHNPHYYEWLRRNGGAGGAAQPAREMGDIPCGGLPGAGQMYQALFRIGLTNDTQGKLLEMHRNLRELIDMRLADYPARPAAAANKDHDVRYLMKEIDEDEWKRQLEFTEAKFKRKKEIGQILQMVSTTGSDMLNQVVQRAIEAQLGRYAEFRTWVAEVGLPQLEQLREFSNQSLVDLAKREHMAVPQFGPDFKWLPLRALYRAAPKKKAAAAAEPSSPPPPLVDADAAEVAEAATA